MQFIERLHWQAQLVAWPVTVGITVLLTLWRRSRALAAAPPVPGAGELQAVELPPSGRTGDLSAAAPVRAAGTVTITDVIRNSRRAGRWEPAGDPEADRKALLAGQAFRVAAWQRNERRWRRGRLEIGGQPLAVTWKRAALSLAGPRRARGAPSLPLALPSRIALTRPVDVGRDRFPQTNDWLFTVVTIRTRDSQETFAIPAIDLPLVHAALELANAEDPLNCGQLPGAENAGRRLLARARRAAVDMRIHAGVVERARQDRHRGGSDVAAFRQVLVIAALPGGDKADNEPDD